MTGSRNAMLAAAATVAFALLLQGCGEQGATGPSWQTDAKAAISAAEKQLDFKITKADKTMVNAIKQKKSDLEKKFESAKDASKALKKADKTSKKDAKSGKKADSKKEDSKSGKKAGAAEEAYNKAVDDVKDATGQLNAVVERAKKAAVKKVDEEMKGEEDKEEKKVEKDNFATEEKTDTPKDEKKHTPKDETKDTSKDEKKDTPKDEKKDTPKEEKKDTPKEEKDEKKKPEGEVPSDKSTSKKEKKDEKPKHKEAEKESKAKSEKFLMVGQDVEMPKQGGNFMAVAFNCVLVSAAVLSVGFFVVRARQFYGAPSTREFLRTNVAAEQEPLEEEPILAEGECLE